MQGSLAGQRVQPFVAARSGARQAARAGPAVHARYTDGGSGNDRRLIMPGQENQGGNRRPLVVPGQGGGQRPPSGGSVGQGLVGTGGPPVQMQSFRPPPGFMDMDGPAVEDSGLSTEEMLDRLRSLRGHWHQLAKLLPHLARAGYDAFAVEDASGLERKTQNVWATAAQIYDSVSAPGLLTPDALEYFDAEDADTLLYELRFLSIKQRALAAQYIADRGLSPPSCQVLARAYKEHERRNGTKEGFADTPGDVLAYKHYRDALECRREEEIEACAKKGLAVADSDEARAKLSDLLEGGANTPVLALPKAQLTMLRLSKDELGFRPIAVAGQMLASSVDQVLSAPKVSSEGTFGNFKVPAEGLQHEWVALPNWSLLVLAGHPVALMVPNCADVPEIRIASSAKSEEELKRLSGQGVVVADIKSDETSVRPDAHYLADDGAGRVRMMVGAEATAAGARVLGPVLFLCRPPSRDGMAATTSELLSM